MQATATKTTHKNATVLRDYTVTAYGYTITVPAGARVDNTTASGPDDNYRFWVGYTPSILAQFPEYKPTLLLHDMEYRGINVPAEYCSEYK